MVSGITQSGMNFAYAYDIRGNITAETRNGATTSYVYDGIGQLVRVNDPHENVTWVYNYDCGGNITGKVKYAYTTGNLGSAVQTIPYTYDSVWKDKLVSYDGASITYDAIGNPLNDGTWTYTWEKGRQLKQMSKSGTTIQFKYDHNGIRTQKSVTENGTTTTTNYIYNGNKLVHLTQGNNWLHFYYSGQSPAMVNYNGTLYTYVKNLQGDIVAILNNAGRIVVEYKYDAWGRPLSSTGSMAGTLGALNPFRYRGYVYDEESGNYYCKERYYSPAIARFINTDIVYGRNLFFYCYNSPIIHIDSNGMYCICLDANGLETSLFYELSGLGGGGSLALPTYSATVAIEPHMDKINELIDDSVPVILTSLALAPVNAGASWMISAIATEAALVYGTTFKYGLKALLSLSYSVAVETAINNVTAEIKGEEPNEISQEDLVNMFSNVLITDVCEIKIPGALQVAIDIIAAFCDKEKAKRNQRR